MNLETNRRAFEVVVITLLNTGDNRADHVAPDCCVLCCWLEQGNDDPRGLIQMLGNVFCVTQGQTSDSGFGILGCVQLRAPKYVYEKTRMSYYYGRELGVHVHGPHDNTTPCISNPIREEKRTHTRNITAQKGSRDWNVFFPSPAESTHSIQIG